MTDNKQPYKCKILVVGSVDSNGMARNWAFDGENNPNSVGLASSPNGYLICGYTIDELREIARVVETECIKARRDEVTRSLTDNKEKLPWPFVDKQKARLTQLNSTSTPSEEDKS